MAALLRKSSSSDLGDRQFCGGALIAPTWVLTAAHCVAGLEPYNVQVLLGRLNLGDANPVLHDVVEIVSHPVYGARFHDIAMIRLATPSNNRSIAIATEAMVADARGQSLQVFGWGAIAYEDTAECTLHFLDAVTNESDFSCKAWLYDPTTSSPQLRETDVTLQPYDQCDRRYKRVLDKLKIPYGTIPLFSEEFTPDILCAWDPQDDSTPCYGDSGGPLVRNIGGTERLFGVVRGGVVEDCLFADQIELYANAAYFSTFIDHTMNRSISLGAARLCPGRITPSVSYAARQDGRQDVKVSWNRDQVASAYRLFYTAHAGMGRDAQKLDVQKGTEVSVVLASGQKFFVVVQGRAENCDGPLSSVLMVNVP